MRTLLIVNGNPYPPESGSPLRIWQHINVMATKGPIWVISVGGERDPKMATMPGVARWTHFNSSDFGLTRSFIEKLARVFVPRQYSVPSPYARFDINGELKRQLEEFKPDIVILSHWKSACPTPLRKLKNLVLDLHNVESLIATGDSLGTKNRLFQSAVLWRWRRRERGLINTAAAVWVCGDNDVALIQKLGGRPAKIVTIPNSVDLLRYERVRVRSIESPLGLPGKVPTIIYVGLFSYPPNRDAATELLRDVFPLIVKQIPEVRLVFVGAEPTQEMKKAANENPSIVVTGRVHSPEPYLAAADVCIIPLRSGGGTRLKILECLASMIPVVSTSKGAEGIDYLPGVDIAVAESSADLAERGIALLVNAEARLRQAEAGYELVKKKYSWEAAARLIERTIVAPGR